MTWKGGCMVSVPSLISLMVSVDVKHHVYYMLRWRGRCILDGEVV